MHDRTMEVFDYASSFKACSPCRANTIKDFDPLIVAGSACNHSVRCVRYITSAPLRCTSTSMEGPLLHGPCGEDKVDAETGNRL
jgi:hypothetical protein